MMATRTSHTCSCAARHVTGCGVSLQQQPPATTVLGTWEQDVKGCLQAYLLTSYRLITWRPKGKLTLRRPLLPPPRARRRLAFNAPCACRFSL
jgi:hypothetical protein